LAADFTIIRRFSPGGQVSWLVAPRFCRCLPGPHPPAAAGKPVPGFPGAAF